MYVSEHFTIDSLYTLTILHSWYQWYSSGRKNSVFAREPRARGMVTDSHCYKTLYMSSVSAQINSHLKLTCFAMPRLSEAERNRAIGMIQGGVSVVDVSRTFNCSRTTIHDLVRRFRHTGDVHDRPRSGRPRATSQRDDRAIVLLHLRNRFTPATLTAPAYNVCAQTIRNRLRTQRRPIRARRPYTGGILTLRHRRARLGWARAHRNWRRRDWNTVLFSDESRFNLSHADGRVRVYRRKGERFAPVCVRQHDRFGGGGVMVWGGIMGGQKTRLIVLRGNLNAQRYINNVLNAEAIPFLRRNAPAVFQHDNARPHTARITRAHLAASNVNVMQWPAMSPDMNPIEHIWDVLGRNVRSIHAPQNIQQLTNALIIEWDNLPNRLVQRYVNSMRRRVDTLIRANGGHNRY